MDPINPWLDPVEVRRMAERLMRPVRDPAVSVSDAGFDEAFVGYASNRTSMAPPPQAPAETPPAAISASVQADVPARIVGPPVESPPPASEQATPEPVYETIASSARGPFLDRIHRFRDWMRHHFAATGIFILDREGSVIFDESNHGRLHFLARSLALASRRPGSSAGNVHVKIGAAATLEVIPVETAYGCLVLGAVVPEALSPAAVSAVMEALTQVAAPPGAV
jgi:hypothetical protein